MSTPVGSTPVPPPPSSMTEEQRIGAAVTAIIPLVDGPLGPGTAVSELGQIVYSMVIGEIGAERVRCVSVVAAIGSAAEGAARNARGLVDRARLDGDIPKVREAERAGGQAMALAAALAGTARKLMLPPGTCLVCNGSKLVASTLNPAHGVPCEACKPAAPAPAAPVTP